MLNSGADVLILNHYGFDMVNSLTQAVQFGMRDKQANGKNFEIVVPLVSELMAKGAGDAIKGIYGTSNWDWQLQDEASKAFTKSFGAKYRPAAEPGRPHRPMCRPCSMPTPANAPAPSIRPKSSRRWKASSSTAWAMAPRLYRAEDHQCFKDVLVVQGKEAPANQFDLLQGRRHGVQATA